jgi:HSP20 family protein
MARLTIWQPFSEAVAWGDAMEQLAQNARARRAPVRNGNGSSAPSDSFPVDLSEHNEAYTLHAILPGVHPDNLAIDFADNVLTIKAESKPAAPQEGTRYYMREITPTRYERSFRFPSAINIDAVEAHFEHGALTLRLPKAETARARRIAVQTAEAQG